MSVEVVAHKAYVQDLAEAVGYKEFYLMRMTQKYKKSTATPVVMFERYTKV
jgi:hypothetical protein